MPKPRKLVEKDTGKTYLIYDSAIKWDGEEFMMLALKTAKRLAREDLTAREYKVLFELFSHLEFENWVRIPQTQIAEELGLDRSDVSRVLAALVSKGILAKGPKKGRSQTYRFDPELVWMGKRKNRPKLKLLKQNITEEINA